jgi:hypothetical protein
MPCATSSGLWKIQAITLFYCTVAGVWYVSAGYHHTTFHRENWSSGNGEVKWWPDYLHTELRIAVYSCSRYGVVTSRPTSKLPRGILGLNEYSVWIIIISLSLWRCLATDRKTKWNYRSALPPCHLSRSPHLSTSNWQEIWSPQFLVWLTIRLPLLSVRFIATVICKLY